MIAKVINVYHVPAQRSLIQGFKQGQTKKKLGHTVYTAKGSGWGQHLEAGKILLVLSVRNQTFELNIGWYFRQKFNDCGKARLTKKRIEKIISSRPHEVSIEKTKDRLQISETDLQDWYNRAFN